MAYHTFILSKYSLQIGMVNCVSPQYRQCWDASTPLVINVDLSEKNYEFIKNSLIENFIPIQRQKSKRLASCVKYF